MKDDITLSEEISQLLKELGNLYDILSEYWDIYGTCHKTPTHTYYSILKAMGVNDFSKEGLLRAIEDKKNRPCYRLVEPVLVLSVNKQPIAIPLWIDLPLSELKNISLTYTITDEWQNTKTNEIDWQKLHVLEVRDIGGIEYFKAVFHEDSYWFLGYYKLSIKLSHPDSPINNQYANTLLIITPNACYIPPAIKSHKVWGISTSLYSIKSDENWGIGDLSDLFKLTTWLSKMRGAFVGINPLHSIPNEEPFGISPYSPITRLYRNIIYIDVQAVQEFSDSPQVQSFVSQIDFLQRLQEVRANEFVDYQTVARLKIDVLKMCFRHFKEHHLDKDTQRANDFKSYVDSEGILLEQFCIFMALRQHYIANYKIYDWQDWDERHKNPYSDAVKEFALANEDEILFQLYCQWLLDIQLRDVSQHCINTWMPLGIYQDLAVGSNATGFDAWLFQDIFAGNINVGAPPDDFNVNGQDWGFPPLLPQALRDSGYKYFITTLKKNMRYSGALRIDHALGLFRLFWIPQGCHAKDGAYVNYPAEDMLRIIALESARNKTVIIAEDLGTVPEEIKIRLRQLHMMSYKLLYFERDYINNLFINPAHYPEMSLCTVGTHDLPTLPAFLSGLDIVIRNIIGLYPSQQDYEVENLKRQKDIDTLIQELSDRSITVDSSMQDIVKAIYEWLAQGNSRLLAVSLDDIVLNYMQQNIPGLTTEYPCWKVKSKTLLKNIVSNEFINTLVKSLRQIRGY